MRSAWAALVLVCVAAAGCAKADRADVAMSSPTGSPGVTVTQAGDPQRGRIIFGDNCSVCHGSTGREGGVGPSLRGEDTRKSPGATVAWIEDPAPPMPKLYPAPLSRRDVQDVAAYVQRL